MASWGQGGPEAGPCTHEGTKPSPGLSREDLRLWRKEVTPRAVLSAAGAADSTPEGHREPERQKLVLRAEEAPSLPPLSLLSPTPAGSLPSRPHPGAGAGLRQGSQQPLLTGHRLGEPDLPAASLHPSFVPLL